MNGLETLKCLSEMRYFFITELCNMAYNRQNYFSTQRIVLSSYLDYELKSYLLNFATSFLHKKMKKQHLYLSRILTLYYVCVYDYFAPYYYYCYHVFGRSYIDH